MKSAINLLLILFLSISITSCGSDKDNEVVVVPPNGGGGGGGGDNGGGGNVDPLNRIDYGLRAVIDNRTFREHRRKTTGVIRPLISEDVRVDLNDSRWRSVSVNDFSYGLGGQSTLQTGMIVQSERLYLKVVNTFRGGLRCAVQNYANFTVMDMYAQNLINNGSHNESVIDTRRECWGVSTMAGVNGLYQSDRNQFVNSIDLNNIIGQMTNKSIARLNSHSRRVFFKVIGDIYDRDYQQVLNHEYLLMADRGEYRVIIVKKRLNGRLVDSSLFQYGLSTRIDRPYYDRGTIQTWNGGWNWNWSWQYN